MIQRLVNRTGSALAAVVLCQIVSVPALAATAPSPPPVAERLSPEHVPGWAQTGRFRYARWDGGILDVVKGFLSGWPHWREPDQALAVAKWYDPRNVELVERAELNWIWGTFSNGVSLESERPHQEERQAFIAACLSWILTRCS